MDPPSPPAVNRRNKYSSGSCRGVDSAVSLDARTCLRIVGKECEHTPLQERRAAGPAVKVGAHLRASDGRVENRQSPMHAFNKRVAHR